MIDSRKRYPSVQEAFEVWKNYMVSMGYGYKLGIDLPGEKRGFIPNSKFYDKGVPGTLEFQYGYLDRYRSG